MSRLTAALAVFLPVGMDLDGALFALMEMYPLTRQELKVSLFRRAAARDEEIATELGISVATVHDHARRAKWKLGFAASRLVGPFLLVSLHTRRKLDRPSQE